MKKTLADLKRDLKVGTVMTMTESSWSGNKLLGLRRYVVRTQGNGIYLNEDKNAKGGSFMDFPKKATLCDYDGTTLTIYDAGYRPLTTKEQAVLDNKPSKRAENAKQVEVDMLTDGNQMYYADKRYTKEQGMEYMDGFEVVRGLKYDFNTGMVYDESIKGRVALQYTIEAIA